MVDGDFRVLGKVVRVVDSDSEESINLLRKTAFGSLNSDLFDELSRIVEKAEGKLYLPDFATEIVGPAIQVMPIAILYKLECHPPDEQQYQGNLFQNSLLHCVVLIRGGSAT